MDKTSEIGSILAGLIKTAGKMPVSPNMFRNIFKALKGVRGRAISPAQINTIRKMKLTPKQVQDLGKMKFKTPQGEVIFDAVKKDFVPVSALKNVSKVTPGVVGAKTVRSVGPQNIAGKELAEANKATNVFMGKKVPVNTVKTVAPAVEKTVAPAVEKTVAPAVEKTVAPAAEPKGEVAVPGKLPSEALNPDKSTLRSMFPNMQKGSFTDQYLGRMEQDPLKVLGLTGVGLYGAKTVSDNLFGKDGELKLSKKAFINKFKTGV